MTYVTGPYNAHELTYSVLASASESRLAIWCEDRTKNLETMSVKERAEHEDSLSAKIGPGVDMLSAFFSYKTMV